MPLVSAGPALEASAESNDLPVRLPSIDGSLRPDPPLMLSQLPSGEDTSALPDASSTDESESTVPSASDEQLPPAGREPSARPELIPRPADPPAPILASDSTNLADGNLVGWWDPYVSTPMRQSACPMPLTVETLVTLALKYSHQLRVYADAPLIRDTSVIEADSAFDWNAYVETMWNDIDEPVGSRLITGGPPRYQDHKWQYDMGVRRRTTAGGQFELGQQFGFENNNSTFFEPNNQGTARLSLNYTQPLLRGAGKAYNTSLIVLAQIDADTARDEFAQKLQDELLEITRAYWALRMERGLLLQKQRLYNRAQTILTDLENRSTIDALANQIVRARAAVAARKSDLYRAAASVKNAEGRIRALVNAPELGQIDQCEFLPVDAPTSELFCLEMPDALMTTMQNRPEIHQTIKQIKASSIRLQMSQKEMLPILDVVMETYANGLQGNSNVGGAFVDQLSTGAPSYRAGLQLEVPLGNRQAKSRLERRALEARQLQSQLQATIQTLGLETEVAVREVQTTYREARAKFQAVEAAESEVDYIYSRWQLLAGEDRSASLLLEDLLSAQERLAAEESEFLDAQIRYNLAITNVKRAMGTLLQLEQVRIDKAIMPDGLPAAVLNRAYDTPDSP
jgi:outer membrane protein TolC